MQEMSEVDIRHTSLKYYLLMKRTRARCIVALDNGGRHLSSKQTTLHTSYECSGSTAYGDADLPNATFVDEYSGTLKPRP